MKRILCLIIVLSGIPVYADLTIKKDHHIINRSPGLCTWCALETLGLAHGWTELQGLTASKTITDYHDGLIKELQKKKVKFRFDQAKTTEWWHYVWYESLDSEPQLLLATTDAEKAKLAIAGGKREGFYYIKKAYCWKTEFIRQAVKDNLGAAVTLDLPVVPNEKPSRHMLVLAGWTDTEVLLIDSNNSAGTLRRMLIPYFLSQFGGFAIIIDKKEGK